jgi:hypothetical protein
MTTKRCVHLVLFMSIEFLAVEGLCMGSLRDAGLQEAKDFSNQAAFVSFTGQAVRTFASRMFEPGCSPTLVRAEPKEFAEVVQLGRDAVPFLIGRLDDSDGSVRFAALLALTRITNKRFGQGADFYRDGRSNRRKRIETIELWERWWRTNRCKSDEDWLIDDLRSRDELTRKTAATKLGERGVVAAIPELRELLRDPELSFHAARSLAVLGDGCAVPFLVRLYLTNELYCGMGIDLLEKLTGETMGFDPQGSEESRGAAIKKWEEWIEKQGAESDVP